MKTTLFALLLLCAATGFGQVGSAISNEPQILNIPSHQEHASQHGLQSEQSLLFTTYSDHSARGERPLWEAGAKPPAEIPLGDIARMFRNEHAASRKAVKRLDK